MQLPPTIKYYLSLPHLQSIIHARTLNFIHVTVGSDTEKIVRRTLCYVKKILLYQYSVVKVKVKVTLELATKAQRGSIGIAVLSL